MTISNRTIIIFVIFWMIINDTLEIWMFPHHVLTWGQNKKVNIYLKVRKLNKYK